MTWELYRNLLLAWMALGAATFVFLFKVRAPFGRHTRAGWGPTLDNRLAWILMEATVLVSLWLSFGLSASPPAAIPLVMMGLFSLHYLHRAFVFPWFLRTRGKRMPLLIFFSAVSFNSINGSFLGGYWGHFANYPSNWLSSAPFLGGLALFGLGMSVNIASDYQLIALRKPGETGYRIPRGRLFEWVSCPNHLGEMLEWAGYAMLTWSLPALAFWFWTVANLAPRAWAHHRWYRQTFPDYPSERKGVIPWLW